MTRKDYVLIAQGLNHSKPSRNINPYNMENSNDYKLGKEYAWDNACKTLSEYLQLENPLFDSAKFLEACGIEQPAYVNSKGETVNY